MHSDWDKYESIGFQWITACVGRSKGCCQRGNLFSACHGQQVLWSSELSWLRSGHGSSGTWILMCCVSGRYCSLIWYCPLCFPGVSLFRQRHQNWLGLCFTVAGAWMNSFDVSGRSWIELYTTFLPPMSIAGGGSSWAQVCEGGNCQIYCPFFFLPVFAMRG